MQDLGGGDPSSLSSITFYHTPGFSHSPLYHLWVFVSTKFWSFSNEFAFFTGPFPIFSSCATSAFHGGGMCITRLGLMMEGTSMYMGCSHTWITTMPTSVVTQNTPPPHRGHGVIAHQTQHHLIILSSPTSQSMFLKAPYLPILTGSPNTAAQIALY